MPTNHLTSGWSRVRPSVNTPGMSEMAICFLLTGMFFFSPVGFLAAQQSSDQQAAKADNEASENPFPNRHPAPELDGGVEWLNAAGPISLKDLRGKIVLIDFWTFCCINCMHVLPDLADLEKKYPNQLVVIGVHSAKFDNEKETGNIRNAILRYEIAHPVVNDAEMVLWRKFGVRSWPTLVLLDPEGQYCGYVSGEGNRELLDKVIDRLIAYHRTKRTLDETPVHFNLERQRAKETPLRYPGKIIADETGERFFISDSNHNRIVICQRNGHLDDVIGSGRIGARNGSYAEAEFDHPQGLALHAGMLYVADTENHLIRVVNLAQKSVSTLAGTGLQDRTRAPGGALSEMALNSPWDLTVVDRVLYIAMAGPHQIWAHKLGTNAIRRYAGSGREDIIDSDLSHAALAQPSGIASDGAQLYVVDSEGSAIRVITTEPQNDLEAPQGKVVTIAGTHDLPRGRSLFEFGDVDDTGNGARFQHPLGIAHNQGRLFVADTYNHKIRQIDLKTREVTTWVGTGKAGADLETLQLAEPAGIAIADNQLYITDTNNHRIVVVDMMTKQARELVIAGLTAPRPVDDTVAQNGQEVIKPIEVDPIVLGSGDGIPVEVEFTLPADFKLNPLLPVSYRVTADADQALIPKDRLDQKLIAETEKSRAKFTIPTISQSGAGTFTLAVTYGYCRDGNGGLCKVATSQWKIPVTLKEGGEAKMIKLNAKPK